MLTRNPTPNRLEHDWFMFSFGLMPRLCSDYIAVRLLYTLEPLTTSMTILPKMVEVIEKSLKLHLSIQTQTQEALTEAASEYGHNVEKLREACAKFEADFDHPDIKSLTKDLNDRDGKLYQYLRYGSQVTTAGSEADLAMLIPIVDRVFSLSLLRLPTEHRRLLLFCSPLKFLVTRSRFDQSRHPDLLIETLSHNNDYFYEFKALFEQLDKENEEFLAKLGASGQ